MVYPVKLIISLSLSQNMDYITLVQRFTNYKLKSITQPNYILAQISLEWILLTRVIYNIYVMHGKQNTNPNLQTKQPAKLKSTPSHHSTPLHSTIPLLCSQHNLQIGNIFCEDCLCYCICMSCLAFHSGHGLRMFKNSYAAKEETKQLLLIEVEKTLSTLKSRQNDLKNKMQEINLIKQKIKLLSQQLIQDFKRQLQQLQKKIQNKLTQQFTKYQQELDLFYREYNQVNNSLRKNLENIIDGTIDVITFSRQDIVKDIDLDLMPRFSVFKYSMQKVKRSMKSVGEAWRQFQASLKYFNNKQQKAQLKYDKYDKFLREKNCNEEHNPSLMKTLKILESNQPDLSLLKAKLRM